MVIDIYNDWILVSSIGLMFAFLFVFQPYGWLMENVLNFKPFNCVLCLTFWSTLLLYSVIGLNPLFSIYSAFIAELSYRKLVDQ
jgi:hypothetical protein